MMPFFVLFVMIVTMLVMIMMSAVTMMYAIDSSMDICVVAEPKVVAMIMVLVMRFTAVVMMVRGGGQFIIAVVYVVDRG